MLRRFASMLDDEALPLPTRVPDMSRPIPPPSAPGHEAVRCLRWTSQTSQIICSYSDRPAAVLEDDRDNDRGPLSALPRASRLRHMDQTNVVFRLTTDIARCSC